MPDEPKQDGPHGQAGDRAFLRRYLQALLIAAVLLLLYRLADVLLLIFGAMLIAVILRAIAKWLHLPSRLALLVAVLFVLGLFAAAAWLFGSQVAAQFEQLREILPAAWHSFEARLGQSDLGRRFLDSLRQSVPQGSSVAADLGRWALSLGNTITNLILVVIAGIFLAGEPRLYRRGALKLAPKDRQEQLGRAFDNCGKALRLWLIGQLFSMSVIGVFTGVGLWLVGVPSALALGLLAGLAEFVPIVGPFASAVPGLLLALVEGPQTALWALAVYVGVQQIESDLLTPLVMQKAVALPPALTLFAVMALAVLFGPLGVLLGAPLAVVCYVLVKQLYVRDTLGEQTPIPGEKD